MNMKISEFAIIVISVFALGLSLPLIAMMKAPPPVIVCDHPEWSDDGFAAVASQCSIDTIDGKKIKVVILD